MASAEEFKQQRKTQWNAAAPGWDAWARWYETNFNPLTDWLCRAAGVRPGLAVLDIASGTGEPALEAAARVRPGGKVVGIDISPQMLTAARRRAAEKGLDDLELLEMDAENLLFDGDSFDAVTFACGLMFCPDPVRALAGVRRVLRPGGRFALAVWDDMAKSPFLTTLPQAFGAFYPPPPMDPNAPGPYRFGPPGALESVIRQAGFDDFAVESRPLSLECSSLDEYWEIVLAFAPGLRVKLDGLPPADRERLRERVRVANRPYMEGERVRLVATPLCAAGRR
jgi:SAM-dependent methyltransferase